MCVWEWWSGGNWDQIFLSLILRTAWSFLYYCFFFRGGTCSSAIGFKGSFCMLGIKPRLVTYKLNAQYDVLLLCAESVYSKFLFLSCLVLSSLLFILFFSIFSPFLSSSLFTFLLFLCLVSQQKGTSLVVIFQSYYYFMQLP